MKLPSLLSMAALPGFLVLHRADAFSMPCRRTGSIALPTRRMEDPRHLKMVGSLSNLFGDKTALEPMPNPVSVSPDPDDWDDLDLTTPEGLIARAKIALSSDLGIQNGNLLADSFVCIGPYLDVPLNKVDYLAAGRFFNLRSTFPDLDYRAHDYRIDTADPRTVRVTVRTVGTMRGELRLRDQTLPPNGQQMRCPPEAIAVTFDPTSGKIVKLCTGFAMDRLVGNTNGLCGVMAAATIAGEPPSDWEIYPAWTVAERFFGRPVAQIGESTSFLAPFPETVMIQLAKGILSSTLAAEDPSLLAKDFTYMTPTKGPISKKKFLEEYAQEEFAGVEPELSHFRVDPYDPNRVWVDVRPLAPGYEGPPQSMSFSFDDDGFCKRITSSAVMDPSLGNAGGLGGPEGFRYAMGEASPSLVTRPVPRAVSRLQKAILSPITGSGVDDYKVQDFSLPLTLTPKPDESSVETLSSIKAERVVEKAATPPPPATKPVQATAKTPTFSIPKLPSFSLESLSTPVPVAAKVSTPKPAIPKPAELKKPVPKSTAAVTVIKSPSSSIPKMPSFSLSYPSTKPSPGSTKINEPLKVTSPTFSIPKLPTLSLSAPPALSKSSGTTAAQKVDAQKKSAAEKRRQEEEAKKAEEQGRADAQARQQRELKLQEEKQRQQAALKEEATKKAEEQRRAEAKARKQREEQLQAAKLTRQAALKEEEAKKAEEQRRAVARAAQEREEQLQAEKLKKQAALKKQEEEEKRAVQLRQQQEAAEAALARKVEAEEKREAEAKARRQEEESRKAEASAKQAAQAEERRQVEEAKRVQERRRLEEAAAEQRRLEARQEAEARRKAEEDRKTAREKKRVEIEKDRAAQEKARKQDDAKRQLAAKAAERKRVETKKMEAAKAASASVAQAKPGATVNLFGLGGGTPVSAPDALKTPAPPSNPRPTINLFGGGGPASTSPQKKAEEVANKAKPGATITLFGLSGGKTEDSKPSKIAPGKSEQVKAAAKTVAKAKPGATINIFGLGVSGETEAATIKSDRATAAAKSVAVAKPGATINLFGLGGQGEAKSAPSTSKKGTAATKTVASVKPSVTINLFGLGGSAAESKAPAGPNTPTTKPAPNATAPRGVPTISGWQKNRDGSITGSIRGSPNFSNGERVTTSPIAQGSITSGSVVKTASGSRYFLS